MSTLAEPFDGDPLAFWGKLLIDDRDAILSEKLLAAGIEPRHQTSDPILANLRDFHQNGRKEQIGVLGAGMAGLYTAIILDSLGIDYDILEASDRVGGRIETHEFKVNGRVVDYYDAGAMRYPLPKKDNSGKYENGVMKRLGELIDYKSDGVRPFAVELKDYYFSARGSDLPHTPDFRYFNGVRYQRARSQDAPHQDPSGFRAKEMGVGERYIRAEAKKIHDDVLDPFIDALIDDFKSHTRDGWNAVKQFDAYSVRGYMASKYLPTRSLKLPHGHLPSNVINWCNLLQGGSGTYDRALTRAVFSAIAFGRGTKTEWKRVQGGSETLPKKMAAFLLQKHPKSVKLGKRATAIEQVFTYYLIPGREKPEGIPLNATKTTLPSGIIQVTYDPTPTYWRLVRYPELQVTAHSDLRYFLVPGDKKLEDIQPPFHNTPFPDAQNPDYYRIDIPGVSPSYWRLVRHQELHVATHDSRFHYLIPGTRKLDDIQPPFHIIPLPGPQNARYYRVDIPDYDPPFWRLVRSRLQLNVVTGAVVVQRHKYDHVIPTVPLPVLRTLDLRNAGLHVLQKNALRGLDYQTSLKIAVRFKSAWWTDKLKIVGGQSYTDLPIRTIVYPSYNDTFGKASKVLIASYATTTDAARLAALALKPKALKELILHNLAEAHHGLNGSDDITYDFLSDQLADGENFHVKDWNADEYTMGAFASFSPGEFEDLYASLTTPAADGTLHFAGEVVSTRHGWVVGALDSGWRAVYEYLQLTNQTEKLKTLWGENSEWTTRSDGNQTRQDRHGNHIELSREAILCGII